VKIYFNVGEWVDVLSVHSLFLPKILKNRR